MYNVINYIRANKDCPFEDYLEILMHSGAKKDVAKILAAVEQLGIEGLRS
jgi:hypothetical protein